MEGSSRLLERDRDVADRALVRHHALLAAAVGAAGRRQRDRRRRPLRGLRRARRGVRAALLAQRAMAAEDWDAAGRLRIRVALHRGEIERRGRRCFGTPLFAAARLLGLAHGDQTLLSDELAAALHLPAQPTPFLGRADEVAASGLGERFPDGVWWCHSPWSASPAGSCPPSAPRGARPAIPPRTWRPGAPCSWWTTSSRSSSILATSREPLWVAAERRYPVPTLERDECVGLLRSQAAAISPGMEVDDDVAGAICGSLDDLPLAIELAAARFNVLAPAEVCAGLHRRLDAVGRGGRDRPDRQPTLRAAIAWSVDLLSPAEREAFERLAVFAGGWILAGRR